MKCAYSPVLRPRCLLDFQCRFVACTNDFSGTGMIDDGEDDEDDTSGIRVYRLT